MKEQEMRSEGTTVPVKDGGAYDRILLEKHELDEKIVKLAAFLNKGEWADKIAGYPQIEFMRDQLRVMIDYSCILNKRILLWKREDKE